MGNARLCWTLGLSLVCSVNVQVWRRRFAIPVGMPHRECLNFAECLNGNLAAVFADAAQQGVSRPAEGAAPPTGVLVAWISLLALQNPLERIIYDPPGRIELGHEAIRRVRWTFNAVLVDLSSPVSLTARAPLFRGPRRAR